MAAEKFITDERLKIYETHLKLAPDRVMAAYHWNKALAGAMLPIMQCLEVTLRNAIDQGIRNNPPPGAKGLWETDQNWIFSLPRYIGKKAFPKLNHRFKMARRHSDPQDTQGVLLEQYGHRVIAKKVSEEKQVEQVRDSILKMGKGLTPSHIIAGLSFGFWTHLLTHHYEDEHSKTLLWPHLLSSVFPHAPHGHDRNAISDAFIRIRELRNRLSHHEAIWKFHYDNPVTRKPDYRHPVYGARASCNLLRKHYDDILAMIGWMSPERAVNFTHHGAHLHFYALCSIEGLDNYVCAKMIRH